MNIILASANRGKIEEFKKLLPNNKVIAYSDILLILHPVPTLFIGRIEDIQELITPYT